MSCCMDCEMPGITVVYLYSVGCTRPLRRCPSPVGQCAMHCACNGRPLSQLKPESSPPRAFDVRMTVTHNGVGFLLSLQRFALSSTLYRNESTFRGVGWSLAHSPRHGTATPCLWVGADAVCSNTYQPHSNDNYSARPCRQVCEIFYIVR